MSEVPQIPRRQRREKPVTEDPMVLVVSVIPAQHTDVPEPRMVPWHDPPRTGPDGKVIMRAIEQGVPHGGHQIVTARVPLSVLLEHVEHVSEPDVLALQVARASALLSGDAA